MSEGPVIIKEPIVPERQSVKSGLTEAFTFARLQNPFAVEVVGTIKDKAAFSTPLANFDPQRGNSLYQEYFIKGPGTDFYIPPELAQFAPVIEMAIKDHYTQGNNTPIDWCALNIVQSSVIEAGSGPHLDVHDGDIPYGLGRNHNTYIACDESPTHFFQQSFKIDDSGFTAAALEEDYWTAMNPLLLQYKNQIRDESLKKFEPYSLVHFDSTNVHQGVKEGSFMRTVCTVAFRPIPYEQPVPDNNPYLKAALEQRDASAVRERTAPFMVPSIK